jgi:hypothetical protein
MKINPSSITYIRWRDPQGLHEDSVTCISELRFAKDELKFLSDLVKSHTLDLISENHFAKSQEVVAQISAMKKGLNPLIKKMVRHSNELETLVDDIDIPDEEDDYKSAHYNLMFEAASFLSKFKKVKRRVFRLIKDILKDKKKRKLLGSGK